MKPLLAVVIAVVAAAAAALGLAVAHDGSTPITSDDGVKALVVLVGSSERIGYTAAGPLWGEVARTHGAPVPQRSTLVADAGARDPECGAGGCLAW